MPTAIVRICTTEGIVIAADGFEASFLRVENQHLQKIYPIHNLPLAYAIFGSTGMRIYPDKPIINLIEEAKKSVDALEGCSFDDLSLYAEHFSCPIQEALRMKMEDGSITCYPSLPEKNEPGHTILHIFFFGYYRGIASTIDLRFFHREHVLAKPSITSIDMDIGPPPWIRGSSIIAELLFDSDDERFSAYRIAFPEKPSDLTINKAAEIAANYIMACSSAVARDADPNLTMHIGGHIHIAKITPSGGFEWIIPPR